MRSLLLAGAVVIAGSCGVPPSQTIPPTAADSPETFADDEPPPVPEREAPASVTDEEARAPVDREEDAELDEETRAREQPVREPVPFIARDEQRVACRNAAVTRDGAMVCPDEAASQGLTILDLHDEWTPTLFARQPSGREPSFRASYLELAAGKGPNGDPLDELYGVVPSLVIPRKRLADDARHACHDAIDPSPIALLDDPPEQGDESDAVLAVQNRLVCEGFLHNADGRMSRWTTVGILRFQRRNFLIPTRRLDDETRAAMLLDSRELDYRLALRILRERVVDATGLIEDGTASTGPQPILGRTLDPAEMRGPRGGETSLQAGAPDLISEATEQAARQLGWTSPDAVRTFLTTHEDGLRVAIALPPPPAYHSSHMNLSAVLDRGDVWYDDEPVPRTIDRRPSLTIFVEHAGMRFALVRWPTTIGGWADVRTEDGEVVQQWKESSVGPRVWRRVYAAPSWLPPKSTPDRDLIRKSPEGDWELRESQVVPGPHNAYGLVLLIHDKVTTTKNGTVKYADEAIGSHGTASVTSVIDGTSHGCHRLFNLYALRLSNFLLRHREHVVKGERKVRYRRHVSYKDSSFVAKVNERGFLYVLTPPVPLEVTEGTIMSDRLTPPSTSAPARPDGDDDR